MSLDSLPACVKKCLQDAAKSAGCGINDVKCICTKDVSTSDGSTLMTCVLGACDTSDVISAGNDLVQLCAQVTGTASPPTGTRTSTSSTSRTTSPDTTATTPSTNSASPSPAGSSITSTAPTSSADTTSGGGGLSTGAKVGIGIGAAVALLLLILGAYILGRRRRSKADPTPVPDNHDGSGVKQDGQQDGLELPKEKTVTELEGARWVPELGDYNTHVAELEADSQFGRRPRH
ncbi:integral membrane protein [Purpureocillium lavendulum]|uniref:Integral membrane protein n=1 Tax=Purpureocillium lavendulum TaxID=1247861 RepID=A0AB34FGS6_9HYPO|nr:integral membrane protein [Purpureocillium lavendulum]